MMRVIEPSEYWEYGWETAELMQLRRDAASTFREKLIWLEEMSDFKKRCAAHQAKMHHGFSHIPVEE